MQKPRPFSLRPIYTDPRQSDLDATRQRLHQQLAASAQRRRGGVGRIAGSLPMLLSLILILAATVLLILLS